MITPLALFAIWLANKWATVLISILSAFIHSMPQTETKFLHLLSKGTALTGNKRLYHSFSVPDTKQRHQLQLFMTLWVSCKLVTTVKTAELLGCGTYRHSCKKFTLRNHTVCWDNALHTYSRNANLKFIHRRRLSLRSEQHRNTDMCKERFECTLQPQHL